LKVDYIYVGQADRDAFGEAARKFVNRPDLFGRVFANEAAEIFVVL
jgi:hypothetical protein